MLTAAVIAAATALAPTYVGRTEEGRRIVVETRANKVTLVHATIDDYECEMFGAVGPIRVHEKPRERVARDGKVNTTTGDRTGRVTLKAKFTPARVSGTLRVRGTIATGQPCSSRTLRFSAAPRQR